MTVLRGHWKALLLGWLGVGSLFYGLSARGILDWPRWAIVVVVLAGLLIAQWRAWDEMRLSRNEWRGDLDITIEPIAHGELLHLVVHNDYGLRSEFEAKVVTVDSDPALNVQGWHVPWFNNPDRAARIGIGPHSRETLDLAWASCQSREGAHAGSVSFHRAHNAGALNVNGEGDEAWCAAREPVTVTVAVERIHPVGHTERVYEIALPHHDGSAVASPTITDVTPLP